MFLSGDYTTTTPHLVLRIFPCSVFCLFGNNVSGSAHQASVVVCSTHLRLGNPHTSGRSFPVWKAFLYVSRSSGFSCSVLSYLVLCCPVLSSSVTGSGSGACLFDLSGSGSCLALPLAHLRIRSFFAINCEFNPSSALNFLSMFSFARRFPTTLRATRSGGLF